MELIKQPAKWQCPYCLKAVGTFGNFTAKIFGTRFHGCDFSNVQKEESAPAQEKIDWEEVINKYITCIKINQAVMEEKAAKIAKTYELNVKRHARGLALDRGPDSPAYFLNHIIYADLECSSNIEFVIGSLERRKEYAKTLQPTFAGIKLDPNITVTTKLEGEWLNYILPDAVKLRWHLVSGQCVSDYFPKHVAERMLAAANKLLQTGRSQTVEYVPENSDIEPDDSELSDDNVT